MAFYRTLVAAVLILAATSLTAEAQIYWDMNDQTVGATNGAGTAIGTWNAANNNWNTDSTGGAAGTMTNWDNVIAIFAAGTDATGAYTVTVDSTQLANALEFEEGTVTLSGGEIGLYGEAKITVASGQSAFVQSVISGPDGLNKEGTGTVTISGTNTYTNFTGVNAGILAVGSTSGLGATGAADGTGVAIGASLEVSASNGETINIDGSGSTGTNGALYKSGTAAVTLSGLITLDAASRINNNGSAGTLTIIGGIVNDSTLTIGGTSNVTINTVALSGAGNLIKDGTNTLTLNFANTYAGVTTVKTGGIVAVSTATSLGTTAGNTVVESGGTVQISGNHTTDESFNLAGNGSTGSNGVLRKTGNNVTTIGDNVSGNLTGSGSIYVTDGTLSLVGGNGAFTGTYNVTNSILKYNDQTAIGNAPGAAVAASITLDGGTLWLNRGGNAGTFAPQNRGVVLGAGGGTIRWDGDTTNANFLFIIQTGSIFSGVGGLTKTGTGIISSFATHTYTGPTTVNEGTLRVRTNNNVFPTATALTINSPGIFDTGATNLSQEVGSTAGNGRLNLAGSVAGGGTFRTGNLNTSTTFSGFIQGGGALIKLGTGVWTLSGDNTAGTTSWTGAATISAGAIAAQHSNALGDAVTGTAITTISSGAQLQIDGTGLSIPENFTISGTGLTALANSGAIRNLANNNTLTGVISLAANSRINSDANTLTITNSIKSSSTTARTLTLGGAGDIVVDGTIGDGTNPISNFTKADAGTVTFNASNIYTGSTTVSAGTLKLGAAERIPDTSNVTVTGTLDLNTFSESIGTLGGAGNVTNNDGTLTVSNSSLLTSGTHSGVISGAGNLVKNGIGLQTLSGANTYGGTTTVSAGTLRANNTTGSATSTGAVTVQSGGKLAGSGFVAGPVTVETGGKLSGGIGTANGDSLTVSNAAVTVQSGAVLEFTIGAPDTAEPADYDTLNGVDTADYILWAANPGSFGGGGEPGYDLWRGNYGDTGGVPAVSDRIKVTSANALDLQGTTVFTINGAGATAPSGTYTLLEYNTGYTGSIAGANQLVNNATGMDLSSAVVDDTGTDTFKVTVTSTVQDRTWAGTVNGDWSYDPAEATNWTGGGQPNGPGAIGKFLLAGAGAVNIEDSDKTLGNMILDSATPYSFTASGINRLITNTYSGDAAINVVNGNHSISAPMTISKATDVTTANLADTLAISSDVINSGGIEKLGAGDLNMSGVISGGGGFTLTTGTATLSGANVYTGANSVAASTTLTVSNAGTTSGTGTGTIGVTGTLNITGRTTGATTINAGGIETNSGATTGVHTLVATAVETISSGATASGAHTNAGTVNVDGTLSGASTVSAGGVETISGGGTASGAHIVAGTVTVDGTLSGATTVNSGGIVTQNASATGTTIVNTGGVINIAGSGTSTGGHTINTGGVVNVSGVSSGAQTVAGGTLNVASSGTVGNTTINTSGVLNGTGTTGNITAASTGHVKPGGAGVIGTLFVNSANTVNFQNGSFFDVDVDSTSADQLVLLNATSDPMLTIGTAAGAGVNVAVNVLGTLTTGVYGPYPIIDYANTLGGGGFAKLLNPAPQGGYTFLLIDNTTNTTIDLQITAAGSGSGMSAGGAVPEPSGLALLLIGSAALAIRRRRAAR